MTDPSPTSPDTTPVWFITGCSSGFGLLLARAVLARGWRAVVTARDSRQIPALPAGSEGRWLLLDLDVTQGAQIQAAVHAAQARFGQIDVLVNNAGYGYQAACEEGDDAQIRAMFDTNVFGLFAMTRAVLPGMRARRKGHVMNLTSAAGFVGLPASGHYAASKHAVEGWSDSLALECGPLGIAVTCVAPGPFRTDFAGRSMRQTPSRIADYADTAGARMIGTRQSSGSQPGDPELAAQAMLQAALAEKPPRHLVLGSMGVDLVLGALTKKLAEVEAWKAVGLSTDYR